MKIILASLALALTVWAAGAQEHTSMDNQTADGYRGIWFTIGQARSAYGAKYSGGLGTYTMKHIPMAVYAPQVDKTFFVYGGTPSEEQKYLLCMAGCYDHKTGMLRRPGRGLRQRGGRRLRPPRRPHDPDRPGRIHLGIRRRPGQQAPRIAIAAKSPMTSPNSSMSTKAS